eukprot:TRINITY_DN63638_c0_g1_i1.p1 TRINITY_DN63638_c0_g1~~TRINITY_DN63638_c0_g1_i1.p1  ORF type:complete len:625 (-),score=56.07 TRINITY_DN63638_c0_g1_i1:77-1951(-)
MRAWLTLPLLLVASHSLDTEGDSDCRCVNPWDALGGIPSNLTTVNAAGRACLIVKIDGENQCFDLDYGGSRCRAWDENMHPWCVNSTVEPLDFCAAEWCYVDSKSCALQPDVSTFFPGLYYSYETCGAVNTYVVERSIRRNLEGKTLRVGVPGMDAPWLFRDGEGKLTGYTPEFISDMALEVGFDIEYRAISNKSMLLHPESSYTACVRDVGLGRLDFCVGVFWQTPERFALSRLSTPWDVDRFVLVVFEDSKPTDILSTLSWVFLPLSPLLWLLILIWSLAVGIALWYMGDVDHAHPIHGIVLSTQLALLRFLGQGSIAKPRDAGLGVVTIGFGFLCLCTLSAYNANLMAFRAIASAHTGITSLDDALQEGTQICVDTLIVDQVRNKYPNTNGMLIETAWYDQQLELMDSSSCGAAIMQESAFKRVLHGDPLTTTDKGLPVDAHCNKIAVGGTQLSIPLSTPVADNISEMFNYIKLQGLASGLLTRIREKFPFDDSDSVCGADSGPKDTTRAITASDMSGALAASAVLIVLGYALHVFGPYASRAAARSGSVLSRASSRVIRHRSHEEPSHERSEIHTSRDSSDMPAPDTPADNHVVLLEEVRKLRDDLTRLRERAGVGTTSL